MTIFKDKTITDNFIFGAVMQNPKLCKALLECILNIKIRQIKYPELEKTISKGVGSKVFDLMCILKMNSTQYTTLRCRQQIRKSS